MYVKQEEDQSPVNDVGKPMVHLSALKASSGQAVYVDDLPSTSGNCCCSIYSNIHN